MGILECVGLLLWVLMLILIIVSTMVDLYDRNVRIKRQNELWRRKNLTPKEELEDFLGGK